MEPGVVWRTYECEQVAVIAYVATDYVVTGYVVTDYVTTDYVATDYQRGRNGTAVVRGSCVIAPHSLRGCRL